MQSSGDWLRHDILLPFLSLLLVGPAGPIAKIVPEKQLVKTLLDVAGLCCGWVVRRRPEQAQKIFVAGLERKNLFS